MASARCFAPIAGGLLALSTMVTLGCATPPRRPFSPGPPPRHVVARPSPKLAAQKATEPALPVAHWSPARTCADGTGETRSLDALVAKAEPAAVAAARTAGKPTDLGVVTVALATDAPVPAAAPEATSELPRDCLFAKVRERSTPPVAAALNAYLAQRDAGGHPSIEELRKAVASAAPSAAAAVARALVAEEELRAGGATAAQIATRTVAEWKNARDLAASDPALGWWAELLYAGALLRSGAAAEAQTELAAIAGRPLAEGSAAGVYELGRIAEGAHDPARALAAFRLVRRRGAEGTLAVAAAWQSVLVAEESADFGEVLAGAVDLLALGVSADVSKLVPEARTRGAVALDHLGPTALRALERAPLADARAIVAQAARLAEAREDYVGAATLAESMGDVAEGKRLRAAKRPAPNDKARMATLARRCFERPRSGKPVDLELTVAFAAEGDVDVTAAPAERGACLRREAPLVFVGYPRPVALRANVQIR